MCYRFEERHYAFERYALNSLLKNACRFSFSLLVGLISYVKESVSRRKEGKMLDDKWRPMIIAMILARMYESFVTELSLENAKR